MKLKQILKSKKGIALENAILFMVIIFSLCALLTSLTLLGHYQVKIEKMTLLNKVDVEQIGEDYLAYLQSEDTEKVFYVENEKYAHEISGNALRVWLKNDNKETTILYVEAEYKDGQIHVYKWCDTLPADTE